jgi:hypothetical protein
MPHLLSVLGIRDILVRIRMRIQEAQKHMDPTDPDAYSGHWHIYIILQRKKVLKKLQNSNQGFSCYFCLTMKRSGSVLVTNGSGCRSGRPKNMIRIPNTAYFFVTIMNKH